MDSPFPRVRVGLAGSPSNRQEAAAALAARALEAEAAPLPFVNVARQTASIGCPNLYLFPNASSTVDATKNVEFKWDTSCQLNADKIDLYIYQSGGRLRKVFQGIPFADGNYSTRLNPAWWNSTETASLYVNIAKNGGAAWDSTWDVGPTFTVDYHPQVFLVTTTIDGKVQTVTADPAMITGDTVFQNVESTGGSKGPSKAVIAVAVIIPIVVIGILAAIAFYFYRIREKEKLKRWSQALSQASAMEWEKGALPGERSSHYRPSSQYSRSGGRPSTGYGRPSTGYGRPSMTSNRPSSSVYLDNMAGAGAGQRAMFPGAEDGPSRSSVVMADGTTRTSRISFADQPRPRLSFNDTTRPHVSSGLAPHPDHAAAVYASGSAIDDHEVANVSPSQVDGPGAVDVRSPNKIYNDDVHSARAATGSVDELRDMEAVMLMRHSGVETEHVVPDHVEGLDGDEQPRSHTPNGSTVQYGPDQMLAVYAARGKVNASPVNTPISPVTPTSARTPSTKTTGMRRFLSRKDKSAKDGFGMEAPPLPEPSRALASPSPEPVSMRSYVHLNNGTASASAIGSLPPPGPPRSASRQSENSRYEDAYDTQN